MGPDKYKLMAMGAAGVGVVAALVTRRPAYALAGLALGGAFWWYDSHQSATRLAPPSPYAAVSPPPPPPPGAAASPADVAAAAAFRASQAQAVSQLRASGQTGVASEIASNMGPGHF